MSLSQRLKALRTEYKDADGGVLKQETLAKMLGCSRFMVSNYENGREPPYNILIKYTEIFDVSADYLLGLAYDKQPPTDDIASQISYLADLSNGETFSVTDFTKLLDCLISYYQTNPFLGSTPIKILEQFSNSIADICKALASANMPDLIGACNDALETIIPVASIRPAWYDCVNLFGSPYTRTPVTLPVAAHGGGVSSTAATPDSAADQTLRERPSDTID